MKVSFFLLFATLFVCSTAMSGKHNDPKTKTTLPELVSSTNRFEILVALLTATKLLDVVVKAKDITIFAPTDFAFAKTAKELGCPNVSTKKKTLECLAATLSTEQVKTVLTYHVVPGVFPSKKVLRTSSFKALNGKMFLRDGLNLIDLATGITNPRLIAKLIDLKYNKGIVHAINRVLIPFINLAPPCKLISTTIATATEEFIKLRMLTSAVQKCNSVRRAVRFCKYSKKCNSRRARRNVVKGISLGDLVAAATTCKSVTMAVKRCPLKK